MNSEQWTKYNHIVQETRKRGSRRRSTEEWLKDQPVLVIVDFGGEFKEYYAIESNGNVTRFDYRADAVKFCFNAK